MTYEMKLPKRKEKKLLDNEGYYGWSNFNTWQVALNIDNDYNVYNESRDLIKQGVIKDGESYKDWFMASTGSPTGNRFKLFDEWTREELEKDVNWDEIYKSHKEELKE